MPIVYTWGVQLSIINNNIIIVVLMMLKLTLSVTFALQCVFLFAFCSLLFQFIM